LTILDMLSYQSHFGYVELPESFWTCWVTRVILDMLSYQSHFGLV